MISVKRTIGGLGNILFQLAFVIAQGHKRGIQVGFTPFKYSHYFQGNFSAPALPHMHPVKEPAFHFTPEFYDGLDWSTDMDFSGYYYQSFKYWQGSEDVIRQQFAFTPEFAATVKAKYSHVFEKPVIAIHVRRGDYVGNPNYENLPIRYYLSALEKHYPNWRENNLLIFSDNKDYVQLHFGALGNAYFADGNEIEDLAAMSMCQKFIVANSSFSFWGAWLSGSKEVVRPTKHFAGGLLERCDIKDFYPTEWISHEAERLDLTDVTFTIPVSWDSIDRQKNLELILAMLVRDFNASIIVMEQQNNKFEWVSEYVDYYRFESPLFHRTKMLNQLAQLCTTEFFVNYDADVLFPPAAILQAVHLLRQGCDMVLPYSGRFVRMPRKDWYKRINESKDIGVTASHKFQAIRRGDMQSAGGAVFFNRQSFFKGGGENENLISFAPDDACRLHRFTTLGFDVQRVNGSCYHVEHQCLLNSGTCHPLIQANRDEWHKVAAMGKTELIEYIKTWEWVNQK